MEKHLLKKLIAAIIIVSVSIYFLGIINTGLGIMYMALTLFLLGLGYIGYCALRDTVREMKGGVNNEQ